MIEGIPHDLPRALICRVLWYNMKMTPYLEKHCNNKYLEGNIEFFKLRNRVLWNRIYNKYKDLFDRFFPIELHMSQYELNMKLESIYYLKTYPRHLDRKLQQAIFGRAYR